MTPHSQLLFETNIPRKRINAGAVACAKLQKQRARDKYYANPKLCENCGNIIQLVEGRANQETRRKRFCNHSCAAKTLNKGKRRHPAPTARPCEQCGIGFIGRRWKSRFCSRKCSSINTSARISPKEHLRRGFGDSAKASEQRRRQLAWEEGVASELRSDGWEVFSPTVVCDRIGVKDGKVWFLEFKPVGREKLRPGQKRIQGLMPENYQVVAR